MTKAWLGVWCVVHPWNEFYMQQLRQLVFNPLQHYCHVEKLMCYLWQVVITRWIFGIDIFVREKSLSLNRKSSRLKVDGKRNRLLSPLHNPSVRDARQLQQLCCLGTHLLIISRRQMWAQSVSMTFALWQSQGWDWRWSAKIAKSLFGVELKLWELERQSVWF